MAESVYANHLFVPGTKNNSWSHLYEYVKDGDRVLDVGCSTGYFGEALIQLKHCEVVGLDIFPDDIRAAATRLNRAEVRNIETDSVDDLGRFDVIIFADVLEHLLNPIGALKKVKALLKNDGRIIFSIPNMGHVSVRLNLLAGNFEYTDTGPLDKTHLHYYDQPEVHRIFEEANLRINRMNPVVFGYSRSQVNEKLEKIGLYPSDKFMQVLDGTYANVLQFVGCVSPSGEIYEEPMERSFKYEWPPQEIEEHHKALEEKLVAAQKELMETKSRHSMPSLVRDILHKIKNR